MSWSATPATQSDIRTCFGAIEDERFYSFLYEGTATPQENQRIETRHAGASNKHSVRDFLKFSHFVATKSTFSYEFSHEPHNLVYHPRTDVSCAASVFHHMSRNATPATEFARCLHLTQPWQCDTQKTHTTTRLNCCACHAKWWWRSPKLRLPQKMEVIFWKRRKSIVPARHTEKLLARYETCSGKSQSATPAIRNEATQGLKPPKYERLRSVADAKVTSSEHTLNLQTPRARREPLLRMWENTNPYDLLLFPMLVNLSLGDTHWQGWHLLPSLPVWCDMPFLSPTGASAWFFLESSSAITPARPLLDSWRSDDQVG